MANGKRPLTATDVECLRKANGKRHVFPGRRWSTFASLEQRGLVAGDLFPHTTTPKTVEFRRAFLITKAGKSALAAATPRSN